MSVVQTLYSPFNSLNGLSTPHVMVGVAVVLVLGLVASVVILSLQKSELDWNKGLLSYIQFAYSCFIKPHERDSEGEAGQQHALESFYRAQVCKLSLYNGVHANTKDRLASTTPLASDFSAVVKIC